MNLKLRIVQRWPDDVLLPFDESGEGNVITLLFFYSYLLIEIIVLLQVVVAVLLDNFFRAGSRPLPPLSSK